MEQENTAGETTTVQTHVIDKDETMWAMFCHLATFAGLIVPFIGNIAGPLLIWLLKRDEYPLVEDQGKEALNFQISMTLYFVVSIILIFVVIGIFLLLALFVFDVIATIIAMVKASEGVKYRYPMSLRLIN
ncbi:hypothetical protein BMS3Abin05_02612 [bacterium BMS3Abin05]|nr:hypothetical protein BMS3Abin05_02612 [bacterium BMS3Abin05]GBE26142.1 hypothetical protein BMS3Bbin03_00053 [bacterium BMS3Bbin03]